MTNKSIEPSNGIPISKFLPLFVWTFIGIVVFGISISMENSACRFNDSNYQKDKYDSPQIESVECLKAYHNITIDFAVTAFIIGVFGTVLMLKSDQSKTNQERRSPI